MVWVMESSKKEDLLRMRSTPRDKAEEWFAQIMSAAHLPKTLHHGIHCHVLSNEEANMTLVVPPAPTRCGVVDVLTDSDCGDLTMIWPAGVDRRVRGYRRARLTGTVV